MNWKYNNLRNIVQLETVVISKLVGLYLKID